MKTDALRLNHRQHLTSSLGIIIFNGALPASSADALRFEKVFQGRGGGARPHVAVVPRPKRQRDARGCTLVQPGRVENIAPRGGVRYGLLAASRREDVRHAGRPRLEQRLQRRMNI